MSTNDVPGARAENHDELAMGCWAEHEDGSLIFVEATEGGQVVYSIFDLGQEPPVEYRTAMSEGEFKRQFTWDPKAKTIKALKWTWHDKTAFPWARVMDSFAEGQKHPSAAAQLTAAQRVADSLQLRGEAVSERPGWHRSAVGVLDRIKGAIDSLRA